MFNSQATALGNLSSLTALVFRAPRRTGNLFWCLSDGIPVIVLRDRCCDYSLVLNASISSLDLFVVAGGSDFRRGDSEYHFSEEGGGA
jgi:hypothetical protein